MFNMQCKWNLYRMPAGVFFIEVLSLSIPGADKASLSIWLPSKSFVRATFALNLTLIFTQEQKPQQIQNNPK